MVCKQTTVGDGWPILATISTSADDQLKNLHPPSRQIALQSPAGQWMRRGFLYLVAVMDWYSRRVLAWRLSNTLDADFCVDALREAMATHGKPEIFNTDQGSQFTSAGWIEVLSDADIKISMDGKGRWIPSCLTKTQALV